MGYTEQRRALSRRMLDHAATCETCSDWRLDDCADMHDMQVAYEFARANGQHENDCPNCGCKPGERATDTYEDGAVAICLCECHFPPAPTPKRERNGESEA